MAATGQCRFGEHVALTSAVGGYEVAIPPCGEAATQRVLCRFPSPGISLEVDTEVCDAHERRLSGASGYVRSIKLRQATST